MSVAGSHPVVRRGGSTFSMAAVLPRVVRPWIAHEARAALVGRSRSREDAAAGRFTRSEVDRLVHHALAEMADQGGDLPTEPTVGSRQNVVLAALTLALLHHLAALGVGHTYGIELTGDVCWRIWCNLDFALAQQWHATLQRSGTLAAGASCCDFRFHTDPPAGPA